MSGPWHPNSRFRVRANSPEAQAVCDRCNFNYSLRDLKFQFQWSGLQLQNLRLLVCDRCLDVPQMQLRTIIIPPDPVPVLNPRPEAYTYEEPSYMQTLGGLPFTTMNGAFNIVAMSQVTPTPDPNQPILGPPAYIPE